MLQIERIPPQLTQSYQQLTQYQVQLKRNVPSRQQSVLLKNSAGIVVARGDLMEGRHLHGASVREECTKVKITDITNPGAKAWFPDNFGEDELEIGMFVQWPTASITYHDPISPLATHQEDV